jgi:hypothetical protein
MGLPNKREDDTVGGLSGAANLDVIPAFYCRDSWLHELSVRTRGTMGPGDKPGMTPWVG